MNTVAHSRSLQDFQDYAQHRPSYYYLLGWLLEIAAWISIPIIFAFLLLLAFINKHFMGMFLLVMSVLTPILIILYLLGVTPFLLLRPIDVYLTYVFRRLRKIGKRYRFNSARTLRHDRRPPILFLRSFTDDSSGNRLREDWRTPEELLVSALGKVGPVVAVGLPMEKLPILGAVRLYFKDDEWQEHVYELMQMSRLVAIQVNSTSLADGITQLNLSSKGSSSKGLRWEMLTARELFKDQPERLCYSFVALHDLKTEERQPPYEAFKFEIEKLYGTRLPEKFDNAYFLIFDRAWLPYLVFVNLGLKKLVTINPAKKYIRKGLKQVLNRDFQSLGSKIDPA